MKKFILISLMAVMALPMMACGWYGTDNIYLYRVYDSKEFSERVDEITRNNWKAYLGINPEYFYFDANQIIEAAKKKNDALMVSYVQHLQQYLSICSDVRDDRWEYPTKEKLAQRNQALRAIQAYAFSKIKTKLRSQHALLYMRCNMVLGLNRDNITFWEQTASQFIETVYKDMMKNIYAGALYKMGRDAEAGELFAEMGDYNSLMTQFYKRRSFEAIAAEYGRNPNAGVLPFLLQDFVNNAQEAVDSDLGGKLFIRDIKKDEALRMAEFAGKVVKEGKTNNPAMWKAAQGWLEYMFGKKQQGYQDIQAATHMAGTEHAQLTARIINFYIKSDLEPLNNDYDAWLTSELKWFREGNEHEWFKEAALTRTINQVLYDKYMKAGRINTMLGIYNITGHGGFYSETHTMKVEDLIKFLDYSKGTSSNPLDEYLISNIHYDVTDMDDLVGTKYMQVCEWEKALPWLERVPVSVLRDRSSVVYAVNRKWTIEPWITRQWISDRLDSDTEKMKLKSNYKIDFAREMLKLEKEAAIAKGDDQCQRYYDLAVRYAQAGYTGDCWYLTQYGKSCVDTVGKNEKDLAAIAFELLGKASQAKDKRLKEKALFGRCYYYLNTSPWLTIEWNMDTSRYDFILHPESSQYQALQALENFERNSGQPIAKFISNCDVYNTFLYRSKQ